MVFGGVRRKVVKCGQGAPAVESFNPSTIAEASSLGASESIRALVVGCGVLLGPRSVNGQAPANAGDGPRSRRINLTQGPPVARAEAVALKRSARGGG